MNTRPLSKRAYAREFAGDSERRPIAYLGLGSNINNPISQVKIALARLAELTVIQLMRHSHLYWSDSLLPGQARYCNAVAEIATELSAEQLLTVLQTLEQQQGRVRDKKWGPRIIDLDIILYAEQIIQSERLQIPHPELLNRDFWLYPLAELNAELFLPKFAVPLRDHIAISLPTSLERISN